jgi:hypothetical protein
MERELIKQLAELNDKYLAVSKENEKLKLIITEAMDLNEKLKLNSHKMMQAIDRLIYIS